MGKKERLQLSVRNSGFNTITSLDLIIRWLCPMLLGNTTKLGHPLITWGLFLLVEHYLHEGKENSLVNLPAPGLTQFESQWGGEPLRHWSP